MKLTFNKRTALVLLRLVRAERGGAGIRRRQATLLDPNPAPGSHWTAKSLAGFLGEFGLDLDELGQVDVCTGDAARRPKSRFFSSTVYKTPLPEGAFLQLGKCANVSSPELLFVELANEMSFAEHMLLGFELTGCYVRDALRPVGGGAKFKVPAVTSTRRIRDFLDAAWHLNGTQKARRTLQLLSDNAWSPFESVVATMMLLPWEEDGYGFGTCTLNMRVQTPEHLVGSAQKGSRAPDILIEGTHVGVNYDGGDHMDLDSIARAGMALGQNPGSGQIANELDQSMARVRAKYVDDGRRNRELSADGYAVYPVFKEDLYQFGGLDRTMMQVMEALKRLDKWDVSEYQRILQLEFARQERQALLQSMIPGRDYEPAGDVREAVVRLPRKSPSRSQ